MKLRNLFKRDSMSNKDHIIKNDDVLKKDNMKNEILEKIKNEGGGFDTLYKVSWDNSIRYLYNKETMTSNNRYALYPTAYTLYEIDKKSYEKRICPYNAKVFISNYDCYKNDEDDLTEAIINNLKIIDYKGYWCKVTEQGDNLILSPLSFLSKKLIDSMVDELKEWGIKEWSDGVWGFLVREEM